MSAAGGDPGVGLTLGRSLSVTIFAEFGDWRQPIFGDFVDGVRRWVLWVGFGQVLAGDLQTVEEQAGSLGVDFVGGQELEDLADGVLDGAVIFGEWNA